jgi:hypothetical protein
VETLVVADGSFQWFQHISSPSFLG